MSTVKMTVKPSQGSQLAKTPANVTIGTVLEALGSDWNYKPGDISKSGKPVEESNAGQVVKTKEYGKFAMRFDKLADDLNKGNYKATEIKAAGIGFKKLDTGEIDLEVTFPCSTIGIAEGKYVVARAK